MMRQSLSCPNCGAPILADQQFCGMCGAKLLNITTDTVPAAAAQPQAPVNEAAMVQPTFANRRSGKTESRPQTRAKEKKYGLLAFSAITFQVLGWIIMIVGGLASIAMIVFAAIGGGFQPLIGGIPGVLGVWAIGLGIGSLIAAFVTGLIFLAFAELFYAVIEISKAIKSK
jgi:hypothetical protein